MAQQEWMDGEGRAPWQVSGEVARKMDNGIVVNPMLRAMFGFRQEATDSEQRVAAAAPEPGAGKTRAVLVLCLPCACGSSARVMK